MAGYDIISPNSRPLHRRSIKNSNTNVNTTINMDTGIDNGEFQTPKKTTKLKHLIQQKAKSTIKTNNNFKVLTDESDDEVSEDENPRSKRTKTEINKEQEENINKSVTAKPKKKVEETKPKKNAMPPILLDGTTTNHKQMIENLKTDIKGKFTIKHTNQSTIIFIDEPDDYYRVLNDIKTE